MLNVLLGWGVISILVSLWVAGHLILVVSCEVIDHQRLTSFVLLSEHNDVLLIESDPPATYCRVIEILIESKS
jgi:hypothetical protein